MKTSPALSRTMISVQKNGSLNNKWTAAAKSEFMALSKVLVGGARKVGRSEVDASTCLLVVELESESIVPTSAVSGGSMSHSIVSVACARI